MNVAEAADLLYLEADLLDRWELDEWLALYAEDCVYWVPAGDNPSANDTGRHVSLVYDDRQRLTERVLRFSTGFAHSQEPRSRLARLVSNVRVLSEQDGLTRVRSKLLISESRFGEARHHGATVEHVLRSTTGGAEVVKKSVFLTESNNFLPNLTYIL